MKEINDTFGHEKGDIYLTTAGSALSSVYKTSPVFRIQT
ncbi:MAG: diguanylate cyclase [Clostridia bacterium]|nr:diguanylate cyclase [Clostridia bacterium]